MELLSGPLPPRRWDAPIAAVLLALLHGYRRWLSPLLGPYCRFEPSCSRYATEALRRHPVHRALGLTTWRLLRCQPWCRGGHDPLPPGRYDTAPTLPPAGDAKDP